ncbi:MAG: hypothetical protein ACYCSH_16595, partial [Acidithiobacillus sp.]
MRAADMAKANMDRRNEAPTMEGASSGIDGEMTRTVRVIGLAIAGLVTAALLAGIWKGSTSAHPGTGALV